VSQELKPSKESLREVKREYKQRQKDEKARKKAADKYWAEQTNPGGSSASGIKVTGVGKVIIAVGAFSAVFMGIGMYQNLTRSQTSQPLTPNTGANSASPSPYASEPYQPVSTLDRCPFCYTPAKSWAVGEHGLVPPAAARVGNFGPHQVTDALSKTIAYLRAATLNQSVVFNGDMDPVFKTLDEQSNTWLQEQHAIAKASKGKKGTTWADVANRFRPTDWTVGKEIRVKNKLKVGHGRDNGELKVHFVNLTAYWLTPKMSADARAVVVRREGDLFFYENGNDYVSTANYGGGNYVSLASVCGSAWKAYDYVEAWPNPSSAPLASHSSATTTWDPTNVDDPGPEGETCFKDQSGFGK